MKLLPPPPAFSVKSLTSNILKLLRVTWCFAWMFHCQHVGYWTHMTSCIWYPMCCVMAVCTGKSGGKQVSWVLLGGIFVRALAAWSIGWQLGTLLACPLQSKYRTCDQSTRGLQQTILKRRGEKKNRSQDNVFDGFIFRRAGCRIRSYRYFSVITSVSLHVVTEQVLRGKD